MPNLIQHIVQPGDTVEELADLYETTVEDIEDANPRINYYNSLVIGQSILIPQFQRYINEQWPPPPGPPWPPWGPPPPPPPPRPWGPPPPP